jgi:hypothetical protein
MARFAKPRQRGEGPGSGRVAAADPVLMSRYPAVWEYLTLLEWEPGKPRRTSTILAFVEDGGLKCCLNDRDGSRSLWVSGASLEACLDALEVALAGEDGAGWRYYQPEGKRKK